jgi:hypothetical protein
LGGAGGNGSAYPISGTPVTYAGGGGGGAGGSPGNTPISAPGGSGGGGAGGASIGNGTAGNSGTGGGGGGGGDSAPKDGGAGGSGIVIVRYSDALGQRAGGGTVTTPSGYIVHTFTGDGTFATNANFGGTTTFSIN